MTTFSKKDQRTLALISEEGLKKLKASHVVLFGLGGVGSYTCEALARAGIGRLKLIDGDVIDETNINRQLYALHSTIGRPKTELAAERCRDIDDEVIINTCSRFIKADEAADFLFFSSKEHLIDYVVDAIDMVSTKIELAVYCSKAGIPLISCCGTGNKLHPELLRIADIYDTSVCPLCRVLRRELKARDIPRLTVCYSPEVPKKTGDRTPASISYVPSAAGLLIASHVVNSLLGET